MPHHVEAFAYDAAVPVDFRAGPAFGQTDAPSMPAFAFGFIGAGVPFGIVGDNLLRLHEPPVFDFDTNAIASAFANGSAGNMQFSPAIPSTVFPAVNSDADSTISPHINSTPGSGLAFLVQQAASPAMAIVANTTAVSSALTGLTELSTASALAASSTFHAQATAIAAKLEGVLSLLGGLKLDGDIEALPQQMPMLGTGVESVPAISASSATEAASRIFADTVLGIETMAKSVGEALLQSLVTDLAQIESGLQGDSIVTEFGHSLNSWNAAALAGAVVALGTYVQREQSEDENKPDENWIPRRLRAE